MCSLACEQSKLNFQPKLPELLQRLRISSRIVHWIMRVLRHTIFLPLSRSVNVFHQPGIDISNPSARETERISAQESMEVVVNELPIKRQVVRDKNRAPFGVLVQPRRECFQHFEPEAGLIGFLLNGTEF